MKKLFVLLLCIFVFSAMALAQTYTSGTGITGVDKLGAHSNGGRGCTGCHAPHSGGKGGGGNAAGGAAAFNDPNSGNDALFGQDMTPLYGKTLAFGDNGMYVEVLPGTLTVANEEIRGIMMCLACHDGQVAKGGMMTGSSWEQSNHLLPANIYGPNPIPTLLGNDGSTPGNYNNDHPVGRNATLGALSTSFNTYFSVAYNATKVSYTWTVLNTGAGANYTAFVAHYGAPVFLGRTPPILESGDTNPNDAYILCTTCHTPHTMYTSSASGTSKIAGYSSGTFPTYFFLTGPYNPGSNPTPQQASSATQFCRQCHFTGAGGANEGSGIMGVTTAF